MNKYKNFDVMLPLVDETVLVNSPVGVQSKPKGATSTSRINGIIIPDKVREFTKIEIITLEKLKYGDNGKTLKPSKRSKQSIALDNCKMMLNIIELNSDYRKNHTFKSGAMLSLKELGNIFKSKKTARHIINSLESGGLIIVNPYYNKEKCLARRYTISESFKMLNFMNDFKIKFDKTYPTEIIKPIKCKSVTKINKKLPQNIMKTVEKTVETAEDLKIQQIIKKCYSKFSRNRYVENGINPDTVKKCECCNEEMPNLMFSISKTGDLNAKCKICWEVPSENESAIDMCTVILKNIKIRLSRSSKVMRNRIEAGIY